MSFRQARLDANKTQAEAAKHMGVDRMSIYQWETGITRPRATRLPRLAEFYGCTIEVLLANNPMHTKKV